MKKTLLSSCLLVLLLASPITISAQDPTDLGGIGTTIPGFVIEGANNGESAGNDVAIIPDVNGDGLADILIGAASADVGDQSRAGAAYLVYGKTDNSNIDLATEGIRYEGIENNDAAGYSVASAGDFNGDGLGDFLIGARQADANGVFRAGQGYIVFGSTNLPAGPVDLNSLDGTDGVIVYGPRMIADLGTSCAPVGDFNGDGYDDVIFGAPGGGGAGQDAFVVFGGPGPFNSPLNVNNFVPQGGGMLLDGASARYVGFSVAGVGDVNGDGISDIAVGAPDTHRNYNSNNEEGAVLVFFGATNLAPIVSASALNGSNGFVMFGSLAGGEVGYDVAPAGDVNGDGFMDIIAGARLASPGGVTEAGEAYLIYGRATFPAVLDINSGAGSVVRYSNSLEFGQFGSSISVGGEWNGDGVGDFVFAAPLGEFFTGLYYTQYGVTVSAPTLGSEDTYIGPQQSKSTDSNVAGGHDVNGNGFSDVAIGLPNLDRSDSIFNAGKVFVLTDVGENNRKIEPYTLRAHLPRNETPLLPIAPAGSSNSLVAPSRFWVGFDGGFGDTNGGSLVTIEVNPATNFGTDTPAVDFTPGNISFSISTNRSSYSSYGIKYKYLESDLGSLNEAAAQLYFLPAGGSEWQPVAGAAFDTNANTVTALNRTTLGTYAIGGAGAASGGDGWMAK